MAGEMTKKKSLKRKFVVEDVYLNSAKKMNSCPVLASFRTAPPQDTNLYASLKKEPFDDKSKTDKQFLSQLTIQSSDSTDQYVGANKRSLTQDCGTLFLGILDKPSGKMKLIEIEEYAVSKKLTEAGTELLSQSNKNIHFQSAKLEFGTKREQKRQDRLKQDIARRDTGGVSSINEAAEVVHSQAQNMDELEAATKDDYSIFPQPKLSASKVDGVYKHIIKDDLLEYLIEEAQTLIDTKIEKNNTDVSPLFVSCLTSAKLIQDENEKLRMICASIYVEYLIRIVSEKTVNNDEMNEYVLKNLKQEFNIFIKQKKRSSMWKSNKKYQDKALAHLIIYCLTIHGFSMDLSKLVDNVPVDAMKIKEIIRLLRLTVVKNRRVELKLPLPDITLFNKKSVKLYKK